MLLTIFSASNYGGVCRNRGGVLIFDEKGPAEVKEFYAPPLDEHRRSVASESQAAPGARLRRGGADLAPRPRGRPRPQAPRRRHQALRQQRCRRGGRRRPRANGGRRAAANVGVVLGGSGAQAAAD